MAELALVERETGADFRKCDGVACVKVLIEQCNYGQSSIGNKTAYCRLPNSFNISNSFDLIVLPSIEEKINWQFN